jgi:apolipoprotein N-acyltransferase
MHISLSKHKVLTFIVAVILSALAYYFSTGFNNVWILLWLAPIPILIYALNASFLASCCAGFLAYFLGTLSYLPYVTSGMPFIYVFLEPALISCIAFVIISAIFRQITLSKNYYWLANFLFAGSWTLFEFIRSIFSVDGTVASLAYTQLTNLLIVQIASLTGIWGVTFLLTLIPSSIVLACYYRKKHTRSLKILVIPCCLLIFTFFFGMYRLLTPISNGTTMKIGIVAINTTFREMSSLQNQDKLNTLEKYSKGIEKLAAQGAEVILLPEEMMHITMDDKNIFLQKFADLAKKNKVHLLIGVRLLTENPKTFYNSAYLFSPDGKLLIQYDKQHPLLTYESGMIRGTSLSLLNTVSQGKWGISICKDNDFINPDRAYAKNGINILFVPAFDFGIDAWVHARFAIMQGITGNYAVARAAQKGLLSLTDNRGRIIALAPVSTTEDQTLLFAEITLPNFKAK